MKQIQEKSLVLTDREALQLIPFFDYLTACVVEGKWLKERPVINFSSSLKSKLIQYFQMNHDLSHIKEEVSLNESTQSGFNGVSTLEILELLRKQHRK